MVGPRNNMWDDNDPCFVISVAARMVRVHTQTLRYYEREGLLEPARSRGNIRLYSQKDIEKLRSIKSLTDELCIIVAVVQVVMRLMERISDLEKQVLNLNQQLLHIRNTRRM